MEFGYNNNMSGVGDVHVGVIRYNYVEGLKRLHEALPNYAAAVAEEIQRIPPASPKLFSLANTCDGRMMPDRFSTSLVHRYLGAHGSPFTAATTTADGSCLFHAASILIAGN